MIRYTLEKARKIGEEIGLILLSISYKNQYEKLLWQCKLKKHIIKTTLKRIKNSESKMCKFCYYEDILSKPRTGISYIRDLEKKTGYKFVSPKYTSVNEKYLWECQLGHKWETSARQIKTGSGCHVCHAKNRKNAWFINEEKTRFIFESICKQKFPKKWIGKKQLDGYCKNLQIAFEYQGIQHFQLTPRFHKTEDQFLSQIRRDEEKRGVCQKMGIYLIEVPYTASSSRENLELFIQKQLEEIAVKKSGTVDWSQFLGVTQNFNKYKKEIRKRDIICLENSYLGSKERYKWKCLRCSYEWLARLDVIIRKKRGCSNCAKNRRRTVEEIKQFAADTGMIFLSKEYKNSKTKYKWKCIKCGHIRHTSSNGAITSPGCEPCKLKKYQIPKNNLLDVAKENNIEMMTPSHEYKIVNQIHSWKCQICNYKWTVSGAYILQGHGCRICFLKHKKENYYKELLKTAEERQLTLLSNEYYGYTISHEWECNTCNKILSIKPCALTWRYGCKDCKKASRKPVTNVS